MTRSLVISILAALAFCGVADASELIARNATHARLTVSRRGIATLGYTAGGQRRHVIAWGARDALAPTTARPQIQFRLDYSGGAGSAPNACGPYRGPALPWLVAACTAPDGSHWAGQSWRRLVPRGAPASRGVTELRLSHWTGRPASLVVKLDWSYRRYDHLYGWLSYRGRPVHGFHSTHRGAPLDTFGRNVYVDTLNSQYGRGWHRENGFLAQNPRGNFCYDFYRGEGEAYRATVVGPGVTPDVSWQSPAPGPFDPVLDLQANLEQRKLAAGSRYCQPN